MSALYKSQKNPVQRINKRMHLKRIANKLPLLFPDYADIVATYGHTYIYPQGFTIDDAANEIHVMYSPVGGAGARQWVAVYDRTTSEYKSCYGIGSTSSGESIAILYEGGARYAYARHSGGNICRVDITNLPPTKTPLPDDAVYAVGIHFELSHRNGAFLIEQNGAPVGTVVSRTVFSIYDTDMNRKGSLYFDKTDTGFTSAADSPFAALLPKRQGIALGDGFIAAGFGGAITKPDPSTGYAYQGVRLYNLRGERTGESIMEPYAMMSVLEQNGITCSRIENEGVCVDASGALFSLYVHRGRLDMPAPTEDGVVIFEELSTAAGAIDFSSAVASYPSYQQTWVTEGTFPRSTGGAMVNPLNGEELGTLEQILVFMESTDLRELSFYTNAVAVTDLAGEPFPATTFVSISSANNSGFFMSLTGDGTSGDYLIHGEPGARIQKQIRRKGFLSEVVLAGSVSDATNKIGRISTWHYLNAQTKFLGVDLQSTAINNTVNYGGGSTLFTAATRHVFYTAPDNVTLTGIERMRIDHAGGVVIKPKAAAVPVGNGEMTFELTSDTTLNVRVKGSDGVIRSAALVLA